MSLNNPILFGLLIAVIVTVVVAMFFLKVLLPLQKKRFHDKQKHILEKAELMSLFSEMDPSPQIRIDNSGKIIQTNTAARRIFNGIEAPDKNIYSILPGLTKNDFTEEKHFVESIGENIFSINIKPGKNFNFINIYLHDVTQQKRYESSLEDYKNKLKELADKLDFSIEEVKKTVSQELHDDIGHSLMALKLKASQAVIDESELQTSINNVYEKVRALSKELRPADIGKLGLLTSIQSIVDNMVKSTGISGSFEHSGEDIITANEISTCIVRVIQEALSNIAKHSKASEFTVGLQTGNETADLVIVDNGVGIQEKYYDSNNYKNYGIGLFNMKERIEKYKGTFRINSNSETGTVLIIQLPLNGK